MAQANYAPRPQAKKGIPVIAWIGIGCGAILIVGFVSFVVLGMFAAKKARDFAQEMKANPAKTTAETLVRLNPELELVESNESAGTITIREKKSGKIVTVKYEDLEKGRLVFESKEGKVEINAEGDSGVIKMKTDKGEMQFGSSASASDVPAWVPIHPNAAQVQGSYTASTNEGKSGIVTFTAPDDVDGLLEYYRSWMSNNGFEVTTNVASSSGGRTGIVIGRNQGAGRTLSVTLTPDTDGSSRVAIQYTSTGD
jgi:hypothetical protein